MGKMFNSSLIVKNKRLTASIRFQHVTRISFLLHHFPRFARKFLLFFQFSFCFISTYSDYIVGSLAFTINGLKG